MVRSKSHRFTMAFGSAVAVAMLASSGIATAGTLGTFGITVEPKPQVISIPLTKIGFDKSKTILKVPVGKHGANFEIIGKCISSWDESLGTNEFPGGSNVAYIYVKNNGVENAASDVSTPDNDFTNTATPDTDDNHHFGNGDIQRLAVAHYSAIDPPEVTPDAVTTTQLVDGTGSDISGLDRGYIMTPKGAFLSFENVFAGINLFGHTGCEFGGILTVVNGDDD